MPPAENVLPSSKGPNPPADDDQVGFALWRAYLGSRPHEFSRLLRGLAGREIRGIRYLERILEEPRLAKILHGTERGHGFMELSEVNERRTNLERAIAAYEEVLDHGNGDGASPQVLADLSIAHRWLAGVNGSKDHARKALQFAEAAIDTTRPATHPEEFAEFVDLVASAHLAVATIEGEHRHLEEGVRFVREAFQYLPPSDFPKAHARLQILLATGLLELAKWAQPESRTQEAVVALRKALELISPEEDPLSHGEAAMALGVACGAMSTFRDREKHAREAIEAFTKTTTIFSPQRYPYRFVQAAIGIANSYSALAKITADKSYRKEAERWAARAAAAFTEVPPSFRPRLVSPAVARVPDRPSDCSPESAIRELVAQAPEQFLALGMLQATNAQEDTFDGGDRRTQLDAAVRTLVALSETPALKHHSAPASATLGRLLVARAEETNSDEERVTYLEKAILLLEDASSGDLATRQPLQRGNFLTSLGIACFSLSRLKEPEGQLKCAIQAFKAASNAYRDHGYPSQAALALSLLGSAHFSLSEKLPESQLTSLKESLAACEAALATAPTDSPQEFRVDLDRKIGSVLRRLGDAGPSYERATRLQGAADSFRSAAQRLESSGDADAIIVTRFWEAEALGELASLLDPASILPEQAEAVRSALRFSDPSINVGRHAALLSLSGDIWIRFASSSEGRAEAQALGNAANSYTDVLDLGDRVPRVELRQNALFKGALALSRLAILTGKPQGYALAIRSLTSLLTEYAEGLKDKQLAVAWAGLGEAQALFARSEEVEDKDKEALLSFAQRSFSEANRIATETGDGELPERIRAQARELNLKD